MWENSDFSSSSPQQVEDREHAYEPQYLEFDLSFPILEFTGKMPRSPFRKPSQNPLNDGTINTTLNTTHYEHASKGMFDIVGEGKERGSGNLG